MDKWNDITKQIKMFIDDHPGLPVNIEIIPEEKEWIKVIMTAQNHVYTTLWHNDQTIMPIYFNMLRHNDQRPTC